MSMTVTDIQMPNTNLYPNTPKGAKEKYKDRYL